MQTLNKFLVITYCIIAGIFVALFAAVALFFYSATMLIVGLLDFMVPKNVIH